MVVFLEILFLLVCLMLVFMVVITPSQSEGLASAFGGMGSDSFFGTKAHQHISKFTIFLAVGFILLAVGINYAQRGVAHATPAGNSILNPGGSAPSTSPEAPTPSPGK